MLLMRNGALLLAALCLAACSSGNPRYNGDKAHHRPTGFVNSDPTANIGNIPLHEVLLRRLRGDFKQGQWDVSLWLKNAFDKTYYTTLWTGGNGGYEGLLGTPRTLGVTGRYDF